MRCAMCGYEFDESKLECHAACPLGAACMVVCCPRCGYSTVNEKRSGASRWLQRLLHRERPTMEQPDVEGPWLRLLDMQPGQQGEVVEVGGRGEVLSQVNHYGLMPGTQVRLRQKHPVPVVEVGQTELAVDHSVAGTIFVRLSA